MKTPSTPWVVILLLVLILAATLWGQVSPPNQWNLVYAHDEHGNAVNGSKADLIAAINAGYPVRIYWAGRRVQHTADAQFLTIFQGEVYAQIHPIWAQRPATDPDRIEFAEPRSDWRTIHSTNGGRALKWFAQR